MINLPPLWRAVWILGALSLFGVMWGLSRLMNAWFDSPRPARLSRLHVQPHKPTVGEGCTPTAPSLTVLHRKATR